VHLAALLPWLMAAKQGSSSSSRAVGTNSTATPSNRLSGLAGEIVGSISFCLNSLWGDTQPLTSTRREIEASNISSTDLSAQSKILDTNIAVPFIANAFRHRAIKSTSSNTSLTSQPVVVRAYSKRDRLPTSSIRSSTENEPQSMTASTNLPSIDAFSFDGILRAIEPEINEAIDGIAEIYARSKLSLADEYEAHLPPQGQANVQRMRYSGLAIRTPVERTLTTVTEASSSSERLAGGSRPGSIASGKGKGKATAYGSLRSIISRGRSSSHSSAPPDTTIRSHLADPDWGIATANEHCITFKRQNTAPMHLTLASVAEVARDKTVSEHIRATVDDEHVVPTSGRPTSWLGWSRSWTGVVRTRSTSRHLDLDAERALKNVLRSSGHQSNDLR
jgi:hypothetical protein